MTSIDELRNRLRAEMPRLRREYAVKSLALHGSRLRGQERPDSDLDVVVEFDDAEPPPDLFDFIALKHALEDVLDVTVDLGERSALSGPAGEQIRREAEAI